MFALLVALAAEPAVQVAPSAPVPAEAPATARSGDLTASQGGMTLWVSDGKPGGQVMLIVDNAGTTADRILSVRTPLGAVGDIGVYPVVNNRGERAPAGDLSIQPGRTGVMADLTDVAPGVPPVQSTVTVVFEQAGEVTIQTTSTTPVAAPPPPPSADR